ncbi:hypothetical protein FCM35_KLT18967 [Carex littledalei]|uniref:Uncharacterized protein n=1 Tax=Carex littledalei TaxID=544730 RepID=A0A833RIA8_9POAL|nr:hypothetical protein FCM35_KLT18967 [Carex littledalei]
MGCDHDGRRRSGRLNPIVILPQPPPQPDPHDNTTPPLNSEKEPENELENNADKGALNEVENEAEEHPSSSVRIRTYFGPNPYLSVPQPQPQPPPQPQPQPQPEPPPQPKPLPPPNLSPNLSLSLSRSPSLIMRQLTTPKIGTLPKMLTILTPFSLTQQLTRPNLIAEKGDAVDLKDVFDRTHLKKSPAGKVYVSDKAKKTAELFQTLKVANGNEMDDEAIWNLAVKGEDKRGRVYGFGQRSRMSKANREVEAMEASPSEPTKSTATSAEQTKRFTAEEVKQLIAAKRRDTGLKWTRIEKDLLRI